VSVNAPWKGGELLTKPLIFDGDKLEINASTAAAGGVRVEVQDEIARRVEWKGDADLGELAGKSVRLRFVLKDADLFSFRFMKSK
jgi:hypothetical protein